MPSQRAKASTLAPGSLWERAAPFAAIAGVLATKIAVALQLGGHPLLQPSGGLDTAAYVSLAREVAAGNWALGPGLYFVSPLYIYFLAATYAIFGSLTAVRLIQCVLGTGAVALVFLNTKLWFGRRAAYAGATAAALCGVWTFYDVVLMQSALDAFLVAAALTALTLALKSKRLAWFAPSGALFALLALNRPNALVPIVVVAAAIVVVGWRAAVRFVVGVSLVFAVVLARNVAVAGAWTPLPSHGGLNLFIGNNAAATGLYQEVPGIRPDISGQEVDTRRVAELALGRRLSDEEVSNYFTNQAWLWIRSEPVEAAQLFLKKLVLVFHADHSALPHSYRFFSSDAKTLLRGLPLNLWFLVPAGLTGLIVASVRRPPAHFWIWCLFVPAYALSTALFFVSERYRLPLLPPLCVGAGFLIDRSIRLVVGDGDAHRTGMIAWIVGALLAFGAVANWPLELADDRDGDRARMILEEARAGRLDSAERWLNVALADSKEPARVLAAGGHAFLEAKSYDKAAALLSKGLDADPGMTRVRIDLAAADVGLGQIGAASRQLQTPSILASPSPELLNQAGRTALAAQRVDLAAAFFERSVALDPASQDGWAQLGLTRLLEEKWSEALLALTRAYRLSPHDPTVLGGLALAEAVAGRADEAERHAAEALAVDPDNPFAQQARRVLHPKGTGKT